MLNNEIFRISRIYTGRSKQSGLDRIRNPAEFGGRIKKNRIKWKIEKKIMHELEGRNLGALRGFTLGK